MLSANLVAKPILVLLTGRVMADQDPPSPTPPDVTLQYGLTVLSVMESHIEGLWDMGKSPHGAIFYLRLPTNGEEDE